jgi:integrase/recombinase XerC
VTSKPVPVEWEQPLAAFAAFLRLRDLSPDSIALRVSHVRRLAREGGVSSPWKVTLDDAMTWFGSQSWSAAYAVSIRASLLVFYGWAVKTKRIVESPMSEFPEIKPPKPKPKPVTEDDYAAALAEATPEVRMMLRLAGDLGMRRAEVAQVHRDDVIETPEGYLLRILGKGRKERVVPMPTALAEDILAWIGARGGGYAFPAPGGGHLTPHWVGGKVSRLLPEGFTMHKLRHRALTRAYATSKDILLTSKLAGHASVNTTSQYYVAPDYASMRALVEGIAS